jgi:acetyl-CoA carboxylase biotin carboxyl carrier protein
MSGPPNARAKDKQLNLKELKEILQLLEEKDITEFELEAEGMKLRVRKTSSAAPPPPAAAVPAMPQMVHAPVAAPPPAPAAAPAVEAPAAAAPAAKEDDGFFVVKSPIVGTFYRSPDPNAAPFVEVGDHVRQGQVLCIVEAMKLMNEIESETGGTIVKAHAESGQPVQYGEPLFTIRPD